MYKYPHVYAQKYENDGTTINTSHWIWSPKCDTFSMCEGSETTQHSLWDFIRLWLRMHDCTMVCCWVKAFGEGCTEVHDAPHLGKPCDVMSKNLITTICAIRSVHPSVNVTITAFWRDTITAFRREPAEWKGECLFNECWMNVMLIWDLFPFSSVITLRSPISSVAVHSDTSAARFELVDKPESSLPGGQICNYVYNESGEDISTSIYNNI